MIKHIWKAVGCLAACAALSYMPSMTAQAADREIEVETSTAVYAMIDAPYAVVRESAEKDGKAVSHVEEGQTYEVTGSGQNGWVKISTSEGEGYIQSNRATLFERSRQKVDETLVLRKQVVKYALQFVGGRYVFGGSDPNTGADCSGFTSYVMRQAAGVYLTHYSAAQAHEGSAIDLAQLQPGDLVFYGDNGQINHVAIYIGDGQIVHASSAKTGIKISDVDHREPVGAVRVLE